MHKLLKSTYFNFRHLEEITIQPRRINSQPSQTPDLDLPHFKVTTVIVLNNLERGFQWVVPLINNNIKKLQVKLKRKKKEFILQK